jgi:hypothetical protein
LDESAIFCTYLASVLKDSKVQPAILSAGEVTKTLAAEMGFALITASAIVITEEPKI